MFKKIVSLALAALLLVGTLTVFASCGDKDNGNDLKVGAILVGDETEGYSLAHMNGINEAVKAIADKLGKTVTVEWKKKIPEGPEVETSATQLIASGCTLIITNSYGHQFNFGDVIKKNPDVTFVAMTGDLAASSGLDNYFNAFTDVYESRYLSGVVAGMKIKELVDGNKLDAQKNFDADGNVKVGYVGAFNYAEVVSGYTAFFLGIKSVYEKVTMTVKYTNSWFSEEREAAVAEFLRNDGCVIIGQHADSTGAPAAIQKTHANGTYPNCYSVGYNVSMLDVAKDVALTSATNNWCAYYETLFTALLNGTAVPADWAEGLSQDAVRITDLGTACAAGTQEAVDKAAKAIKDGTLKVFDCSKFTVEGKNLTTYTGAYGMNNAECIKKGGEATYYFDESSLRAAPYFDLRIDGITEIASDYKD